MAKINTLNYQTVAAWNGSQDLFVVEQPDGTKVATPNLLKQFIEAGDFEATGEVKDGHGNILKDMAKSADVNTALAGKQDTLTFDNAPTANSNNPVKSGGVYSAIAALENIKVAYVSATMNVATADAKAIGGYRSTSGTSKAISTFTGYPAGKTLVAASLFANGSNGAVLGVVRVDENGIVYLNTAATGDYTVRGYVFYKD